MNERRKMNLSGGVSTALGSIGALVAALLIGGIIITIGGFSFVDVYAAIFQGSLGTQNGILLSLATATPLMFTGLGFAIGIKVGIVNTGLEGQLYMGGLTAALVGAYFPMPSIVHVVVAMLAGAIAGGCVGMLTGWFRVQFGASEVITGIMLNSIILNVTSYLANVPLKPEGVGSPQTEQILETAQLTKLVPRSQLTSAIIVAVVMCVLVYFMQSKTVWGYKMLAVGLNPRASLVAGISSSRMYLLSMSLSGAMAGLAGAGLSLGLFYRFIEQLSNNLGFQGIPVSALAGHNPLGVIVSALLFGVLKAGATMVNQSTTIPFEFVDVVQALVVVFVAAPAIITDPIRFIARKVKGRGVKNSAAAE